MKFFKVTIPIALAFTMAVLGIASTFISHSVSSTFIQETAYWSKTISGVTMFIGAFNLLRIHFRKIKRQQKGWGYSGLLYIFFAAMLTMGISNRGLKANGRATAMSEADAQTLIARLEEKGAAPALHALKGTDGAPLLDSEGAALFAVYDAHDGQGWSTRTLVDGAGKQMTDSEGNGLYIDFKKDVVLNRMPVGFLGPLKPRTMLKDKDPANWLYQSVQRPASATQYSLLGFFICSAAYRTFRMKSGLASVLLISALIVMFGQVPIASLVWDKVPLISGWLLDIPNMAVKRAILFGICVGSVGTSLRVMFGIERSYMGGE